MRSRALNGLRADAPIYIAAGGYTLICLAYVAMRGAIDQSQIASTVEIYAHLWWRQYGLVFPLGLFAIGVMHVVHRMNRRRGLAVRTMFTAARLGRLLAGTVLLVIMVPFHTAFNSVKNMIPDHPGFAFDQIFADFDRALFFGIDPYQVLYAVAKHEWVLRVLEINYGPFWLLLTFGALYWVAVSPKLDALRVRYFISFILTWAIVGSALATIFGSAGPVYFGVVTGDHARFADQVSFLLRTWDQPGSTASSQIYLWTLHVTNMPGLGSGISAFPSMHLATVTLNAMFLRELRPRLAIWGYGYVAIMLVSSVYLGWHYAVDGIASIVVTAAIYWAVRAAMSPRWRSLPALLPAGAVALSRDSGR